MDADTVVRAQKFGWIFLCHCFHSILLASFYCKAIGRYLLIEIPGKMNQYQYLEHNTLQLKIKRHHSTKVTELIALQINEYYIKSIYIFKLIFYVITINFCSWPSVAFRALNDRIIKIAFTKLMLNLSIDRKCKKFLN